MSENSSATGWVSVRHLKHIIARGEAAGLRMDELLDEAGLPRAKLSDADGLIPMAVLEALLTAFAQRYSDPLMGLHLASNIQPATFGALGYISQSCTTFADVIETVCSYRGLLSNIGQTETQFVPGNTLHLQWHCLSGSPFFKRHATEYVLGVFVNVSRLLLAEDAAFPREVHFSHARPEGNELARKYFEFFQCPVYFEQPSSCLVIDSALLKTQLRYGDAFMKDLLDRHARNLIRQREQVVSFKDEVRRLVMAMIIQGLPTKEMVATQLGTSTRSLHRRLQELGSGYREILDEVRLEMAFARLRESEDTVNEISEQLGFSTHQAFLRWFRQMTGATPGGYRRANADVEIKR